MGSFRPSDNDIRRTIPSSSGRAEPLPDQMEVDCVRYVALDARPYTDNGAGRLLNMADFRGSMLRLPSRVPSTLQKPDAIIVHRRLHWIILAIFERNGRVGFNATIF